MDLEQLHRQRKQLEDEANKQITGAIEDMREDISVANRQAAEQVKERDSQEPDGGPQTPMIQEQQEQINRLRQEIEQRQKELDEKNALDKNTVTKPLVYLAYPKGEVVPAWVVPLTRILQTNGYLVYNPQEPVDAQYAQDDLPALTLLTTKLVKTLCPLYFISEDTLLPFEAVWQILHQGDTQDNYGIVFQRLWFLIRSSLVICDLTQTLGSDSSQELLYSRQLDIPVIGFLAPTGNIDPYIHRSVTAFFSGKDLGSLLPMIKGYAPV
jgi:hypothetical protein